MQTTTRYICAYCDADWGAFTESKHQTALEYHRTQDTNSSHSDEATTYSSLKEEAEHIVISKYKR